MNLSAFFSELKRRRVFQVAAVYAAVAFVIAQVADIAVPGLRLPDWSLSLVLLLLILGFPLAVGLAWVFDVTPEGVRREEPAAGGAPLEKAWEAGPSRWTSRRLAAVGGGVALASAGAAFLALGGSFPRAAAPAPELEHSIAVLPFLDLSPGRDHDWFSDGITEDLLANLSRVPSFRVISRTSVMRYKGTELPIREIARELGVGYVLEGSVRREGNAVRITAQLIDVARDAPLWTERYDRELTGIFQIQTEIAERIAGALAQHLSPAERARLAVAGTANLTAYDLLLRGREYLNRPGEGDMRKYPPAIGFFRQAVGVDPQYARGYAALAETFRRYVGLPAVPVRRDSILFYARQAVDLDPTLPEGVTELGFGYLFAGDYARTEAEFRRGLALDPNQVDAMSGLARLATLNGRLDEAIRWERRAVAIDPLSPQRLMALGWYLFEIGDLEGAGTLFTRAVALAPDFPEAHYLLAQVHLLRGEEVRADAQMRSLMAVAGDHSGAHFLMGKYLGEIGRYREAEAHFAIGPGLDGPAVLVFRALIALRQGDHERAAELFSGPAALLESWEAAGLTIPPRARLARHVLRGDRDGALATIRQHWRGGLRWIEDPPHIGIYWLDRDPFAADLRDDPRFQALFREMRAELDVIRARLQEEDRW